MKREVKKNVSKQLKGRHIDALYNVIDKLLTERMDALEKENEKQ